MTNRDSFLANIGRELGRKVRHIPTPMPDAINHYADTRLSELTPNERCNAFIDYASKIMLVRCMLTTPEKAAQAALNLCQEYGQSPVIMSADSRLEMLGITAQLQHECHASIWDPIVGELNIHLAEQAKVGVVYADYGLTESGSVVLFSSPESGRSISLLPESTLFVLCKSTILPRVAQLAQRLNEMALQGKRLPSCINLIAGPSSTADIELIKVVGVHGPVNAAYLIIEDC